MGAAAGEVALTAAGCRKLTIFMAKMNTDRPEVWRVIVGKIVQVERVVAAIKPFRDAKRETVTSCRLSAAADVLDWNLGPYHHPETLLPYNKDHPAMILFHSVWKWTSLFVPNLRKLTMLSSSSFSCTIVIGTIICE